jgi:hypothetical protein
MQLIRLAEVERAEARSRVRMADDAPEARAEGSAESSNSGQKTEPANMKALQREVFEAVLRELELSHQRRKEDPDVSIWW